MGGRMLAKRRFEETQEVAKRLGISYDVPDKQNVEVIPTLEIRLDVMRKSVFNFQRMERPLDN